MNGFGVGPLQVKLLDGGKCFRGVALVENIIKPAFAYRIHHQAMLITQHLFFLRVRNPARLQLFGVRSRPLAYAASADENLGLQQIVFPCFALHVVHSIFMLNVGIEAENHRNPL